MKICYVVDNLDTKAGYGRLAQSLASHFRTLGHEVSFVTQSGDTDFPVAYVKLTRFVKWKPWTAVASIAKIRHYCRDADIVVCFDAMPYGVLTCLALLGLRSPRFVLYAIGTYSLSLPGRKLANKLTHWVYRKSVLTIFISEFVRSLVRSQGLPVVHPVVIPVGVTTDQFYYDGDDVLKCKKPYMVSVGMLKHRKGYHLSLEGFALIADQFPDLHYYIRADHEDSEGYAQHYKRRVRELGLDDRITFLPRIDDRELRSLYSNASLFVLTPVTTDNASVEGFGMVFIEAGACRVPVIGTYNSGAEAAIEDGVSGLLVEPEPQAIAKAIAEVVGSERLQERLGKGGELHSRKFSWDTIAKAHLVEYEKLVASS